MSQPENSERGLSIVAGVVTALAVIGLCGGGGALYAQRRMAQVKRGWVLQAVAVGARDVPAGGVLTADDVVVGEVPEQLVTGHAVLASERPSLVGKKLLAPLARGELVDRGHLIGPVQSPVDVGCFETAKVTASSLGLDGDESVKAFLKRLGSSK
ncbi:MAG: SAF domain-containing protein [Myxococcales bacterium]|nr:SAF domain-containing protein [Myxococcales bacterium]